MFLCITYQQSHYCWKIKLCLCDETSLLHRFDFWVLLGNHDCSNLTEVIGTAHRYYSNPPTTSFALLAEHSLSEREVMGPNPIGGCLRHGRFVRWLRYCPYCWRCSYRNAFVFPRNETNAHLFKQIFYWITWSLEHAKQISYVLLQCQSHYCYRLELGLCGRYESSAPCWSAHWDKHKQHDSNFPRFL